MSACLQAYQSDPVVSDLFSTMLNDGAISAVHSFKTRGGKWALGTCKRSEYVKFQFRCKQWSIPQSQQLC